MTHRERLVIYDVSLRDGLQRHQPFIPTSEKLRLFEALTMSGLSEFEVTSFVSPKAVPQLADAADLYQATQGVDSLSTTRRDALVINERGLQSAIASEVSGVCLVLIASDTLSQRNSRVSAQEGMERARGLIALAKREALHVRAYVAAAWVCPFEGLTPHQQSVEMTTKLLEWGADEVALADTVGHATPPQVRSLIERVIGLGVKTEQLAVHLHDTLALGLANACAALEAGVRRIDASVGGLGGCPFAPGAAGNLATEDLVLLATRLGYDTGVDLEALYQAVEVAEEITGRSLGGRTRAWWSQRDPSSPLSRSRLDCVIS